MKFRIYLCNLRRILSVWADFSIYPEGQSKFHFLICHKLFWAYLRQGLFKKVFTVSFPEMKSKSDTFVYLPYLHKKPLFTKKRFNKTNYVDEILKSCGFLMIQFDHTSSSDMIYYFMEI